MTLIALLLLAAGAVAYVGYPLMVRREDAQSLPPSAAPNTIVVHGVAYATEEEWTLDRLLGKVDEGEPEAQTSASLAELADRIERRVAALRVQGKRAPAVSKRSLCPACGRAFQAGDQFCGRCGTPHPHVCPQCGERHRPGDNFCPHCGVALPGGQE